MAQPQYEYQTVNADKTASEGETVPTITATANHYAKEGWRTVSVIPSHAPRLFRHQLFLERVIPAKPFTIKDNPHDPKAGVEGLSNWIQWNIKHGVTDT